MTTGIVRGWMLALLLCMPLAATAFAQGATSGASTVRPESVKADVEFLASDALQGRGSATEDEAKAAAWVGSQFRQAGLVPAPGMSDYLQTATIIQPVPGGESVLGVAGKPLSGLQLLSPASAGIRGTLAVATSADPAALPAADVVALSVPDKSALPLLRAALGSRIKLLILRRSPVTDLILGQRGGPRRMPPYLEGDTPDSTAVAVLPGGAFDKLKRQAGQEVSLAFPGLTLARLTTTNAIGYLPGTDPQAGMLLLSAHLDHLGRRPDGTIMPGADDDASGVAAVVELARALAAGPRSRRGILFVCYGSEEIGGFGSHHFADHPPVPLDRIVANIEFEMIGAQDPKLPKGTVMMTGFERSNLGESLAEHGALVAGDPYPTERFFERSDNYELALRGVVAHTISGWAVTPVYHQPTDTVANLDIPYMTRAIQSLVEPIRWLAASDFQPQWKAGGRPTR